MKTYREVVSLERGLVLKATVAEPQIRLIQEDGTILLQVDQNGLISLDGVKSSSIYYDHATSGLIATTVQGAIDELALFFGPPPTSYVFGGNTFGDNAIFGLQDNFDLIFNTNALERLRITNAGFCGLGTDTPSSEFDLVGAMTVQSMAAPAVSPAGNGRIYFDSGASKFKISEDGSSYIDLVPINHFLNNGSSFGGLATLGTNDNFALAFETNNIERARIDTSGNLGLGTSTFGTSAAKVLQIANGVVPASAPADSIAVYANDFAAGDSRLYVLTESGSTPVILGNNAIQSRYGIFGSDAELVSGSALSVVEKFNGIGFVFGASVSLTFEPTAANNTDGGFAAEFYSALGPAATKTIGLLGGVSVVVQNNASSFVDSQCGLQVTSKANNGPITENFGIDVSVVNISNSDVIPNNYGLRLKSGNTTAVNRVTNDYTVYVKSPESDALMTNHYGIYLEDQAFGTNSWGIFSAGGVNHFEGGIGIGSAVHVPTCELDIGGSLNFRGIAEPDLALGSEARIYFDSVSARLKVSENGADYAEILTETTGFISPITAVDIDHVIADSEDVILADASSAQITVTLPTPVGRTGREFTVKRMNSGSNKVIVASAAGNIDNASSVELTSRYQVLRVKSDNSNWWVV